MEARSKAPLFDSLHRPLVLIEAAGASQPASDDPNRFVSGWRQVQRSRRVPISFRTRTTGRIQVVRLGPGARELTLVLDHSREPGRALEYRIDGGAWQRARVRPRLSLPLPLGMKTGRLAIDLRPVDAPALRVVSAALDDALPAGESELRDGDLIQSGFSAVEVVHKLEGKGRLRGTLQPPREAESDLAFHIEVETEQASTRAYSWSTSEPAGVSFNIPLPGPGFCRIRFVAEGAGSAARWRDLRIESRPRREVFENTAMPALPRVVVLYIMDALRADHLQHLGGPDGISPTIDRLASEGATFRNHFSVAPNTVPSTKSLLTGNRYLLKGGQKLTPDAGPTLAERYLGAGRATGLFSSNGNVASWLGMTRGFQSQSARVIRRSNNARKRAGYNNSAEVLHEESLRWLDSMDDGSPVFMHLQTVNPHNPYDPPEPFNSRFVTTSDSDIDGRTYTLKAIRRHERTVTHSDQQRLKELYAASVAYNDSELESFLNALLSRYPPEEVLFVFTSDHGEELFDHGGVLHGYTLYDEMLRIPLVMWWPGTIGPGTMVDALTDNVDLHATLATMVSSEVERESLSGESLWPYLTGGRDGNEGKEVVFAAASSVKGGMFMARSRRHKLVHAPRAGANWGMGQGRGRSFDGEYVFDLTADPQEQTNLAGDRRLEADWLRQQLDAWVEIGKQLESGEEVEVLDDATRESLEALGYL